MRGLLIAILFTFVLVIHLLLGTAMVEPVGEDISTFTPGRYNTAIDRVYSTYFQWIPLIWAGGALYFAVRWYTRRERFAGRPPI